MHNLSHKMAETVLETLYNTVKQSQVIGEVTNLCCDSCIIVKDQLLQVFQEIKSARTIITLLQEDHQVKSYSF